MKKPYTILVCDPAESTGFAVVSVDEANSKADIFHYDYINVDNSTNYAGDALLDLSKKIKDLIIKYDVKMVVIEDYFFGSRFASGANMNPAYRAAIHMTVRSLGLPYEILNISQWKSFIAGRSTPTKEQKKKWSKTTANKLFIQEALWLRHGIKFPNHSISEKTGKPIKFRFDIVDAVGQAVCYCKLMIGIKDVSCSVNVPDDVEWKKASDIKSLIDYSTR